MDISFSNNINENIFQYEIYVNNRENGLIIPKLIYIFNWFYSV